MPAQYAAPDGLDLRLYGRSADGESVVVEKNIESLSIALILDVNFPDANAALRELKKRMGEHDVSRLCMKMAVKRRCAKQAAVKARQMGRQEITEEDADND